MKQIDAVIALAGVNRQLISDGNDARRHVLSHRLEVDINAGQIEMDHWGSPFDTFEHAGCYGREKEFDRIESIRAPRGVDVHFQLR
jgi:hypothetical protein